jgi:hypothetical protein
VPLITVDTSVALPATLSPSGLARKLWVVLAFGAVAHRAEHLRLDREALLEAPEVQSGELHGADALDVLVERAEQHRAALVDLLPVGTPSGYVAAGFAALFDEYERKVRERGAALNPTVRPEDAGPLRRQFEAICVAGPPPFVDVDVPALTKDPAEDPIVYGALLAGCDVLISDDRDIVPDRREREYAHREDRLHAMTFGHFMNEWFEPRDFPWSDIDGAWLGRALRPYG